MKKIICLLILAVLFNACSEEDTLITDPFVVAFKKESTNIMTIESQETIVLVYSEATVETGIVTINLNAVNATYGVDFTTVPEAINNTITLLIQLDESDNSIQFNKLNTVLDETTEIILSIEDIDYTNANIQGNTSFVFNVSASFGGSIEPEVGGPNEGNQVFIDFSSETSTTAVRDSWDLGFYGGESFRVAINGSIYMAAGMLDFTDIDAVKESDVSSLQSQVAVGTFNTDNEAYIDAPSGDILKTAIAEVSENDSENKVYLLNLGYEVGTAVPNVGSAAIAGDHRGWKKIRVLKRDSGYLLQYADLDATTHQEVVINKDSNYNFSFFSLKTNTTVNVEPEESRWDIGFTVFTNVISGSGSYGYSDFVVHNRKGGVTAYMVETTTSSYDNFSLTMVDENLFLEDQTAIGSNWRDVFTRTAFKDRFFILKDANENYYKINFLALTNSNRERGFPELEYKLLQ